MPSKLFGQKDRSAEKKVNQCDFLPENRNLKLKTTVESIESIINFALESKQSNSSLGLTENDDDSTSGNSEATKMNKSDAISMIKVAIQGLEKEQHEIQTSIGKHVEFARHRLQEEDKRSSSLANEVVASCAMKKAKILEAKQIQLTKVRSSLKELELNIKNDDIPLALVEKEINTIMAIKNDYRTGACNLSRQKLLRAAMRG